MNNETVAVSAPIIVLVEKTLSDLNIADNPIQDPTITVPMILLPFLALINSTPYSYGQREQN